MVKASCAAGPAARFIEPVVTAVSPEAPKLRVYVPVGPLIAKPLKGAAPVAPVVAVGLGGGAAAGAGGGGAVGRAPVWVTRFAPRSCPRATGRWGEGDPA